MTTANDEALDAPGALHTPPQPIPDPVFVPGPVVPDATPLCRNPLDRDI